MLQRGEKFFSRVFASLRQDGDGKTILIKASYLAGMIFAFLRPDEGGKKQINFSKRSEVFINAIADRAMGEFTWFATLDVKKNLIHSCFTAPQINTYARTEVLSGELDKRILLEAEPSVNLWIHSHGDMNVFFSEEDNANMKNMKLFGIEYALVINKRRQALMIHIPTRDEMAFSFMGFPIEASDYYRADLAIEAAQRIGGR